MNVSAIALLLLVFLALIALGIGLGNVCIRACGCLHGAIIRWQFRRHLRRMVASTTVRALVVKKQIRRDD